MTNDESRRSSGQKSIERAVRSRAAITLADAATGDGDKIKSYILHRHASASRRWTEDRLQLRYNDPNQQLRARVYEVGCALVRAGKADGLIAVSSNVRGGRGRSHASVFSAIFGLLSDELPRGFSESNCRKAAQVMEAARFYDIHSRYVILFAEGMKGWAVPIKPSQISKLPAWVHALKRTV